jgi:hypothetical protein
MNWNALAVPKYRQEGSMICEECEMPSVNILVEFSYGEN